MSDNPIELLLGSAQFKEIVAERKRTRKPQTQTYNPETLANWRRRNREATKAHQAVRLALKAGVLKRGPCAINNEDCEGRIEGHHWHGYSEEHRLDVVWLCKYHHEQADTK